MAVLKWAWRQWYTALLMLIIDESIAVQRRVLDSMPSGLMTYARAPLGSHRGHPQPWVRGKKCRLQGSGSGPVKLRMVPRSPSPCPEWHRAQSTWPLHTIWPVNHRPIPDTNHTHLAGPPDMLGDQTRGICYLGLIFPSKESPSVELSCRVHLYSKRERETEREREREKEKEREREKERDRKRMGGR